jgi:hypothetical protein
MAYDGSQSASEILKRQMEREQSWFLSASQNSLADYGLSSIAPAQRPQSTGGLPRSWSEASMYSSLPTLKMKSAEKNPVLGCLPDEVRLRQK